MTIEQINSSKVLIALCNQDMEDYRLEFDSMDLENSHSRKILSRLIRVICTKTGLSTENKRLLLEALPYESGCLILVTFMEIKPKPAKYRIKKTSDCLCFTFDNTEDFLDCTALLYRENVFFPGSKAYLFNNLYYLVFEYYPVPKRAKIILNEFGKKQKCTRLLLSSLKEAGKVLCEKNAVETIGKAFAGQVKK